MITQVTPITKMTNFVNGLRVRKSKVLNAGYFTSLTIITDRKTSTESSTQRHIVLVISFPSSQIIKIVNDATKAAEAGIGNPRNSFLLSESGNAAKQLYRASRSAPHRR
jgi:hypothetical protein